MSINIVRAWKDAEYRNSLSAEELAMVPENPAGEVELSDQDLAGVVGADNYNSYGALVCQGTFLAAQCGASNSILSPNGC